MNLEKFGIIVIVVGVLELFMSFMMYGDIAFAGSFGSIATILVGIVMIKLPSGGKK